MKYERPAITDQVDVAGSLGWRGRRSGNGPKGKGKNKGRGNGRAS